MKHIYTIQEYEDKKFWDKLLELPSARSEFPITIEMGYKHVFAYAPYNCLDGWNNFGDLDQALTLLVPPTPSPINNLQYFMAPQVGQTRRIFAAMYFGKGGQGILAEVSPVVLLHKPLGLRMPNGAVNKNFGFNPMIIKGDDAPVQIMLSNPRNPEVGLSMIEETLPDGTAYLNISLQVPYLVSMNCNHAPTF